MNAEQYAALFGLRRVGARPGLWAYVKQTWARRTFAYQLAKSRIKAANQANRLGVLWEVLKPTLNALMYGFIFGFLQSGGSKPHNYAAFVVIGVFLFEFFGNAMQQGAKSITGNRALVQSLSFPRMTLPFSTIIQQLLTLAPMVVVMFVYVLVLGETPRWSWLLIVPLLVLYAMFNMGVALVFARLTVHLNDLTQIIPFINRMFFFTSGVLFSVDRIFQAFPWIVKLYDFHPIYQVLEIARGIILSGHPYVWQHWISLGVWAVVMLVGGVIFFWQAEERYGRVS